MSGTIHRLLLSSLTFPDLYSIKPPGAVENYATIILAAGVWVVINLVRLSNYRCISFIILSLGGHIASTDTQFWENADSSS